MPRVRKALRFVRGYLGHERPLIEQDFLTDGADLFVEQYSRLINVSRDGQSAMRAVLRESLERMRHAAAGSEPLRGRLRPQQLEQRRVG